jgi:hypothetical protein
MVEFTQILCVKLLPEIQVVYSSSKNLLSCSFKWQVSSDSLLIEELIYPNNLHINSCYDTMYSKKSFKAISVETFVCSQLITRCRYLLEIEMPYIYLLTKVSKQDIVNKRTRFHYEGGCTDNLSQHDLKSLYFVLVHSHLPNCPIIMSCTSKSKINRILKVQNKANLIIAHSNYNDHTAPLFRKLGLLLFHKIKFHA